LVLVKTFGGGLPDIDFGIGDRFPGAIDDLDVAEQLRPRRRRTDDRAATFRPRRIETPERAEQVRRGLRRTIAAVVE